MTGPATFLSTLTLSTLNIRITPALSLRASQLSVAIER